VKRTLVWWLMPKVWCCKALCHDTEVPLSLWAKLLRLNQRLKQLFFLLVLKAGSRKSLDKI